MERNQGTASFSTCPLQGVLAFLYSVFYEWTWVQLQKRPQGTRNYSWENMPGRADHFHYCKWSHAHSSNLEWVMFLLMFSTLVQSLPSSLELTPVKSEMEWPHFILILHGTRQLSRQHWLRCFSPVLSRVSFCLTLPVLCIKVYYWDFTSVCVFMEDLGIAW